MRVAPSPASVRRLLSDAGDALLDERRFLTADELARLADVPDRSVPALAALAHEVRLAHSGPTVEIEGILSAKTGGCPEDCSFCSQSSRYETPVKATPFLDTDEVLLAAEETARLGASEFCIVLAVRGPDERTMARILELGCTATTTTSRRPGRSSRTSPPPTAGTSGSRRAGWCGRRACSCAAAPSSAWARRSNSGWSCWASSGRSIRPRCRSTSSTPARARPSATAPLLGALEALRWIALFRLALPGVILRYAGGREVTLRDLQALGMTSGINALIVGNYLTTLGRSPDEDLAMLQDLRMPVGALGQAL